jgi:hypothetical protein
LVAGGEVVQQAGFVLHEFERDMLRVVARLFGDDEFALAELFADLLGLAH